LPAELGVTMFNHKKRAVAIAAAYCALRGDAFKHAAVSLSLNSDVLEVAIQAQIVEAMLSHYGGEVGNHRAALFLASMLNGSTLTLLGIEVMDMMLRCICEDVRQMLDAGLNPVDCVKQSMGRFQ
jgi:hypothetical protein